MVDPAPLSPGRSGEGGDLQRAAGRSLIALFSPSETVSGRVEGSLGDGTYAITVRGRTLVAESATPLVADTVVRLRLLAEADGQLRVQLDAGESTADTAATDGLLLRRLAALGLPATPDAVQVLRTFESAGAPLVPARLQAALAALRTASDQPTPAPAPAPSAIAPPADGRLVMASLRTATWPALAPLPFPAPAANAPATASSNANTPTPAATRPETATTSSPPPSPTAPARASPNLASAAAPPTTDHRPPDPAAATAPAPSAHVLDRPATATAAPTTTMPTAATPGRSTLAPPSPPSDRPAAALANADIPLPVRPGPANRAPIAAIPAPITVPTANPPSPNHPSATTPPPPAAAGGTWIAALLPPTSRAAGSPVAPAPALAAITATEAAPGDQPAILVRAHARLAVAGLPATPALVALAQHAERPGLPDLGSALDALGQAVRRAQPTLAEISPALRSALATLPATTVLPDPAADGPGAILRALVRAGLHLADEMPTDGRPAPVPAAAAGTADAAPLRRHLAAVAAELPPTAETRPIGDPLRTVAEAVTRSAREAAAQEVLPPRELADYDRVVPLALRCGDLPTPARLAVAARPQPGGARAAWLRVDAELSELGPVSVRLGGVEGGPVAITVVAHRRAGLALAEGLPDLVADLERAGLAAAVRITAPADEVADG